MACYIEPSDVDNAVMKFSCVFCNREDKKLRFLKCLHSCCKECLVAAGRNVTCPVCDSKTVVPNSKKTLPPNCLQMHSQSRARLAEAQVCFMCKTFGKTNIGTYVCVPCDQGHLCDLCFKAHGNLPSCKHHTPIALKDLFSEEKRNKALEKSLSTPMCPDHPTQPLNMYCESCARRACHTCISVKHKKGKHKIITAGKYAKKKLEEEKTALLRKRDKLLAAMHDTQLKEGTQSMEKEKACNEVNDQIATLKQMLDAIGQEYIAKIESVHQEQKKAIREKLSELTKTRDRMEHAISVTTMIQNTYTDIDMAEYNQFFSECLAQAGKYGGRRMSYDQVIIKKSAKRVIPTALKDLIGKLEVQKGGNSQLTDAVPVSRLEAVNEIKVETVNNLSVKGIQYINGLDVTNKGDLLVAGTMKSGAQSCIEVYTTKGVQKPSINHYIQDVWQIAADGDDIYVGNRDENCVTVLTKQGIRRQNTIKAKDDLGGIIGVGARDGRVYLASQARHKLYSCRKGDTSATQWAPGVTTLSGPYYLCITPKGDIVVSNNLSHSVSLINLQEEEVFTYGGQGSSGDGQLCSPQGVCCDGDGRIYIADCWNHRVSLISPQGQFITNVVTEQQGIKHPIDVKFWNNLLIVAHASTKISIFRLLP